MTYKQFLTIDMSKVEYRLGVSYQETIDALTRNINELYSIIEKLQERVLLLEITESGDGD